MEPNINFSSKDWCLRLYRVFGCMLTPEFNVFDDSFIHLLQDKIKNIGSYTCLGERNARVICFRGSQNICTIYVLWRVFSPY